jgi:hypothetical protein
MASEESVQTKHTRLSMFLVRTTKAESSKHPEKEKCETNVAHVIRERVENTE